MLMLKVGDGSRAKSCSCRQSSSQCMMVVQLTISQVRAPSVGILSEKTAVRIGNCLNG